MEYLVLATFLTTWILAWRIFRRRYRSRIFIEQSPNLNGKIEVLCDGLPNKGVRIRIKDKLGITS